MKYPSIFIRWYQSKLSRFLYSDFISEVWQRRSILRPSSTRMGGWTTRPSACIGGARGNRHAHPLTALAVGTRNGGSGRGRGRAASAQTVAAAASLRRCGHRHGQPLATLAARTCKGASGRIGSRAASTWRFRADIRRGIAA